MEQERAEYVVEKLRERDVMAHLYNGGVYQFGIRVVIPDGREAIWDADGAAGLEATIMQDGDLVGLVPTIPGSDNWNDDQVIDAIARAEYDS